MSVMLPLRVALVERMSGAEVVTVGERVVVQRSTAAAPPPNGDAANLVPFDDEVTKYQSRPLAEVDHNPEGVPLV